MLAREQLKIVILFLACIALVRSERLPLESIKSDGKCEGQILVSLNTSAFSCLSACDAESQCAMTNIMKENGSCQLLSHDSSLPVKTETAEGWSCYNRPNLNFCSVNQDPQVVYPCCVLGTSRCVPARSCLHLKTTCPTYLFESGLYWIQGPSINAIQMFCDMETYGGGWTKVANVNTTSGIFPGPNAYLSDDISLLDRASSGFFRLSTTGLRTLRGIINFTQLRVFCFKLSVGRTFHIATKESALGYSVVDYMTGQSNVRPTACNSYSILADDTSEMSRRCNEWAAGTWGFLNSEFNDRLYGYTAYIGGLLHIIPGSLDWLLCDDYNMDKRGSWAYFVR